MKTKARILVVGDSGVGKSSFIHKVCYGKVLESPEWTVGCTVEVKLLEPQHSYGPSNGSSMGNGSTGSTGGDPGFVEFLDVGCHNNHALSRSMYYNNVNGILMVYDTSNIKSFINLRKWINELRKTIKAASVQNSRESSSIYQRSISSSNTGLGMTASGSSSNSVPSSSDYAHQQQPQTISDLPVLVVGNKVDLVRNRTKIPNVQKTLGFESVNISSVQSGTPIEMERLDHFIQLVIDSKPMDFYGSSMNII